MNSVRHGRELRAECLPTSPVPSILVNVLKQKLMVLIGVWTLAIGLGLHALMVYKGKAGFAGQTPETWPVNELLSLSTNKPLLVMFAHPRCPCTKASLGELELLMAKAKDQFEAAVLFYQPRNGSEAWSRTELTDEARSIPGVTVMFDQNGKLASRFGVETSGHTVVYGPDGKLLFTGGITGSRGHLGDNAGLYDVLKIVSKESDQSGRRTAPVFGCEIFDQCTHSQPNE